MVDGRTVVPPGYARDGQIVLNIGPEATNQLELGNEFVTFQARFGGVAHTLAVPVRNVAAVYARENGHGMAFELETDEARDAASPDEPPPFLESGKAEEGTKPASLRSHLKIVK